MTYLYKIITVFYISMAISKLVFAAPEMLRFEFQNVSIEADRLLLFSKKNENNIIHILRQKPYEIKILILNKVCPLLPENINLTIGNVDTDRKAVSYYEEDLQNQTLFKMDNNGIAEFQAPFNHWHHTPDEEIKRPYLDQPLILLTKSATKKDILHEYLHYCIYKLKEKKIFLYNGIQHGPQCHQTFQYRKANKLFLSQDARDVRIEGMAESIYNYLVDSYGEEMDIYSLLFRYGKELDLSKGDQQSCEDQCQVYVDKMFRAHCFLKHQYSRTEDDVHTPCFKEAWISNRVAKQLINDLVAKTKTMLQSLDKVNEVANHSR